MFQNRFRLRKKSEVDHVFRRGKMISGGMVLLKFMPNRVAHVRVAILVGTKISKLAVQRNRIKRRLRESLQPLLLTLPSVDLLVVARTLKIADVHFLELTKECELLLRKLPLVARPALSPVPHTLSIPPAQ